MRESRIQAVEVNFLCIHKSIRDTRLAPMLIKEVTRRVNLSGTFQALYTAGRLLPEPIATARYFHRPLNFTKLLETDFAAIPLGATLADMKDRYRVSKSSIVLRVMEEKDLPACYEIFLQYTRNFDLAPKYSLEEFSHWILPRMDLLYSYVVEDDNGKATDFVSFYSLPSTVLGNELHFKINIGYLFYYGVSDTTKLEPIVQALLTKAKEAGFDVFNALDIMDNQVFLKALNFAIGDGSLHYYLYNWKTSLITPDKIGVAML